METELKRLQDSIDKALLAADSLKKSTNGTDYTSFESSLDSYCKSLENIYLNASSLSPDSAHILIPDELLEIVSAGQRTDDYNSKIKENIEQKVKSLKSASESYTDLDKNLKLIPFDI